MLDLSRLERRILALLEEAGELDLVAMINSVAIPRGRAEELRAMQVALCRLLDLGLISFTYWLAPLPKKFHLTSDDARMLLKELARIVVWSPQEGFWQIVARAPLYEIEVTDAGYEIAYRILEEEGYPLEPLPEYE